MDPPDRTRSAVLIGYLMGSLKPSTTWVSATNVVSRPRVRVAARLHSGADGGPEAFVRRDDYGIDRGRL
jgi:hypothetical protein